MGFIGNEVKFEVNYEDDQKIPQNIHDVIESLPYVSKSSQQPLQIEKTSIWNVLTWEERPNGNEWPFSNNCLYVYLI